MSGGGGGKKPDALFEAVLVVSLRRTAKDGPPEPFVSYKFPPDDAGHSDSVFKSVSQFCFPEAQEWLQLAEQGSSKKRRLGQGEQFSFVLTQTDGSRKYGYCRRFAVKPSSAEEKSTALKLLPVCFVVLSSISAESFFCELLDAVEARRRTGGSAQVFQLLQAALAKPLPEPSETLTVRTFDGSEFSLTRPEGAHSHVDLKRLFKLLPLSTVLNIFSSLVCEDRVIICSAHLSRLSCVVGALSALLHPFPWQHIYIPVLPRELVTYATAPMPFFVGMLSDDLEELNRYPIEEVLLINIDEKGGKLLREAPPHFDASRWLPSEPLAELKRELTSLVGSGGGSNSVVSGVGSGLGGMFSKKKNKSSDSSGDGAGAAAGSIDQKMNASIASCFLRFYAAVVGVAESLFQPESSPRVVDHATHQSLRPPAMHEFIGIFQQTQIFESFCVELERLKADGRLERSPIAAQRIAALQGEAKPGRAAASAAGAGAGAAAGSSTGAGATAAPSMRSLAVERLGQQQGGSGLGAGGGAGPSSSGPPASTTPGGTSAAAAASTAAVPATAAPAEKSSGSSSGSFLGRATSMRFGKHERSNSDASSPTPGGGCLGCGAPVAEPGSPSGNNTDPEGLRCRSCFAEYKQKKRSNFLTRVRTRTARSNSVDRGEPSSSASSNPLSSSGGEMQISAPAGFSHPFHVGHDGVGAVDEADLAHKLQQVHVTPTSPSASSQESSAASSAVTDGGQQALSPQVRRPPPVRTRRLSQTMRNPVRTSWEGDKEDGPASGASAATAATTSPTTPPSRTRPPFAPTRPPPAPKSTTAAGSTTGFTPARAGAPARPPRFPEPKQAGGAGAAAVSPPTSPGRTAATPGRLKSPFLTGQVGSTTTTTATVGSAPAGRSPAFSGRHSPTPRHAPSPSTPRTNGFGAPSPPPPAATASSGAAAAGGVNFCPNCGAKAANGGAFCADCGTKLR